MRFKKKTTIRILALVIVLVLGGLSVIPVWAYQGIGGSPYASDLLVSGLNTGLLDPGQEYWYAYSRRDLGDAAYDSIILSLNFEAEGTAVASRVNFQVFTFNQVDAWLKDNSGPVDSLGLGTPASADFDVNTGERLWAGPIAPSEVYYVRIFNLPHSPIQFRLTALGQTNGRFDGFMAIGRPTSAQEARVIPAAVGALSQSTEVEASNASVPVLPEDASPASTSWLLAAQAIQGLPPQEAAAWLMSAARLGWLPGGGGDLSPPAAVPVDPNPGPVVIPDAGDDEAQPDAVAIAPIETEPAAVLDPGKGDSIYPNQPLLLLDEPNTGLLAPKSEHWYTFTPGKLDDKLIENYSLTIFFTPGEPNLARYVTFEIFDGGQYHIWERGTPRDMEHFGAGSWVSRDGDYITGERLWHGTVVDGNTYFVKITNGTNKWIDYHLVPEDTINMELGGLIAKVRPISNNAADKSPVVEVISTGKDIGAPLVLNKSRNQDKLSAGEDRWFSFRTPNTNQDSFDFLPYLIQLTQKPGDGNLAPHINFEIYPFQAQHIWRRGGGDQMEPLGVGGFLEYDEEADTQTWLWDGHLVSNTDYFIRIKNGAPQEIDYDLVIRRR
jgi:hypothetical protein